MSTMIKIKNGTDRMMLTIVPSTALVLGAGQMPSLRVITRITPSGIPIRYAMAVDTSVIYSVSSVPCKSSCESCAKLMPLILFPPPQPVRPAL